MYELCGLDVICYVGHLSTCHPCWASMNRYMLCICLNCTYVLRSVEEMEKNCFQACRASKGGTTTITEHCANGYRASQSGETSLSRQSRWHDKPVAPPRPARQGLTRSDQTSLVSMAGWRDTVTPAQVARQSHAVACGVTVWYRDQKGYFCKYFFWD